MFLGGNSKIYQQKKIISCFLCDSLGSLMDFFVKNIYIQVSFVLVGDISPDDLILAYFFLLRIVFLALVDDDEINRRRRHYTCLNDSHWFQIILIIFFFLSLSLLLFNHHYFRYTFYTHINVFHESFIIFRQNRHRRRQFSRKHTTTTTTKFLDSNRIIFMVWCLSIYPSFIYLFGGESIGVIVIIIIIRIVAAAAIADGSMLNYLIKVRRLISSSNHSMIFFSLSSTIDDDDAFSSFSFIFGILFCCWLFYSIFFSLLSSIGCHQHTQSSIV